MHIVCIYICMCVYVCIYEEQQGNQTYYTEAGQRLIID